jgi:arginase
VLTGGEKTSGPCERYSTAKAGTPRFICFMSILLPRLIGLPYDATSSYLRGSAAAPAAIRAALNSSAWNGWSENLVDTRAPGVITDGGDVTIPEEGAGARAAIEAGVTAVLADGARPIALGGDHAVTYPAVRAVHRTLGPVTILHIDAHPDLYDEYEGDRYTHASPFARVMEERLATRLVQVGIRAMNGHQRRQADRYNVEVIDMKAWSRGARPSIEGGPVYLSIDLDGIDPAYTPGVSHREPGGLTVRDVIGLIQDVGGTLVGADVVEYNPSRDLSDLTAMVAAKLVRELAGRMILIDAGKSTA